jgi:hypothetical protein
MDANNQSATCKIVTRSTLDSTWADYFGGLTIAARRTSKAEQVTVLKGQVSDFAAFVGLLARLQNLGLPVQTLTFECFPADQDLCISDLDCS